MGGNRQGETTGAGIPVVGRTSPVQTLAAACPERSAVVDEFLQRGNSTVVDRVTVGEIEDLIMAGAAGLELIDSK